jgi:hypothetical protein
VKVPTIDKFSAAGILHQENERLVRAIEDACIEYEKHPEVARRSTVYARLRDSIADYRLPGFRR